MNTCLHCSEGGGSVRCRYAMIGYTWKCKPNLRYSGWFFSVVLVVEEIIESVLFCVTAPAPGGSVRGERANLKGLVLGCIEGKF